MPARPVISPFTIDLSGLAKVLLDLCPQAGHPFRGPRPTAGATLAEGWHHIRPGAGAGSRAVVVRVYAFRYACTTYTYLPVSASEVELFIVQNN